MMTHEEKVKMYQEKKAFIDNISKVFEAKPVGSSVETIEYEVYHKEVVHNETVCQHYVEFVVVKFIGGGFSASVITGNSNTANFKVIGPMLNGGYYEENQYYESMKETGYKLVKLSANTFLDKLLARPMMHISDVRTCFNYCRDGSDVERVLGMIPAVFGTFEVSFSEDDEDVFLIVNSYEENGDYQTEEAEYEFWTEG
jgi:hypothetical protein